MLDEFQYLAARNPALATELNRWWRQVGRELPLVLVVAGSEVAFFERDVLAGQMYGRRTGQWQIAPFDHRAAALFAPGYSPEDKVRTYRSRRRLVGGNRHAEIAVPLAHPRHIGS